MKKLQRSIKGLLGGIAMALSVTASFADGLILPPPTRLTPPTHFYKPVVSRDPVGLIVTRLNVLGFQHPEGGYIEGEEWHNRYYHIKTPVKHHQGEMWRYDLTGYSYGIGKPINFTWVGYFYSGSVEPKEIINGSCSDTARNNIPCSQYQGEDGFLYLKFGPLPQYYNSFRLDYQSGSTGSTRTVHKPNSYRVILTKDEADNF